MLERVKSRNIHVTSLTPRKKDDRFHSPANQSNAHRPTRKETKQRRYRNPNNNNNTILNSGPVPTLFLPEPAITPQRHRQ